MRPFKSLLTLSIFIHLLVIVLGAESLSSKDSQTNGQLQHLHILFRHGDRTPMEDILHTSAPFEQTWPLGRGQLTERGILQEFQLGQWIRQKYDGFIPLTYNISEFHMRSTDIDRTLMSAQAVSAGIYQNASSPLQDFGIPWRPIPVHTVRQEADVLLSIAKCPCLDALRKIQMNSDAAIDFEQQHSSLFDLLNKNIQSLKIDRFNHWMLVDLLICMKANNITLPSWCTEEVFKEMIEVDTFYWNLQYASTHDIVRLEIGVFLHAFVQHLNTITNSTKFLAFEGHDLSVQHTMVYSAHDTDVTYLLAAFGAFDKQLVPYSSAIVLELLGPKPPSPIMNYRLRLRYKRGYSDSVGEYKPLAPCLNHPGKDGCPLPIVLEYLESLVLDPRDFEKTCNGQTDTPWQCRSIHGATTQFMPILITTVTCIIVIILLITLYTLIRARRRRLQDPSLAPLYPVF